VVPSAVVMNRPEIDLRFQQIIRNVLARIIHDDRRNSGFGVTTEGDCGDREILALFSRLSTTCPPPNVSAGHFSYRIVFRLLNLQRVQGHHCLIVAQPRPVRRQFDSDTASTLDHFGRDLDQQGAPRCGVALA
jgi:hypothetical protein